MNKNSVMQAESLSNVDEMPKFIRITFIVIFKHVKMCTFYLKIFIKFSTSYLGAIYFFNDQIFLWQQERYQHPEMLFEVFSYICTATKQKTSNLRLIHQTILQIINKLWYSSNIAIPDVISNILNQAKQTFDSWSTDTKQWSQHKLVWNTSSFKVYTNKASDKEFLKSVNL